MTPSDINIAPYSCGVLPALLAVYIYAITGKTISYEKINDFISVTNFYKFSLHGEKNDIHPESIDWIGKNKAELYTYWNLNDALVKKELEILEPSIVFSFSGNRTRILTDCSDGKFNYIQINDPSWILKGGSKVFSDNGSWYKDAITVDNAELENLIDNYLEKVSGTYAGKREAIKIYLKKYYKDWKI